MGDQMDGEVSDRVNEKGRGSSNIGDQCLVPKEIEHVDPSKESKQVESYKGHPRQPDFKQPLKILVVYLNPNSLISAKLADLIGGFRPGPNAITDDRTLFPQGPGIRPWFAPAGERGEVELGKESIEENTAQCSNNAYPQGFPESSVKENVHKSHRHQGEHPHRGLGEDCERHNEGREYVVLPFNRKRKSEGQIRSEDCWLTQETDRAARMVHAKIWNHWVNMKEIHGAERAMNSRNAQNDIRKHLTINPFRHLGHQKQSDRDHDDFNHAVPRHPLMKEYCTDVEVEEANTPVPLFRNLYSGKADGTENKDLDPTNPLEFPRLVIPTPPHKEERGE